MSQLEKITFVSLNGRSPPGQSLDAIPDPVHMQKLVRSTFERFCRSQNSFHSWDGIGTVAAPEFGLHMVYVYGHAWLSGDGVSTSWRTNQEDVPCDGAQAVSAWLDVGAASRTILILDCCHAAAFGQYLDVGTAPLLVIYASSADESAIALISEQTSRLSLMLAKEVARKETIDLVRVAITVADVLDKNGVIQGQTVTYRMSGSAFKLTSAAPIAPVIRERTSSRIRRRLIILGALATLFFGAGGWYYFTHLILDLDLAGIAGISRGASVSVSLESPDINVSSVFFNTAVKRNRLRIWAHAGDLILRVHADYSDGAERALNFHLVSQASLSPESKLLSLTLPPATEVLAHPGMAYVPSTSWFHGRDREAQRSEHSFWIDIRPPTVEKYGPIAERLLAVGMIKPDNSYILTSRARSSAIDATGVGQVRELNKSLGGIFGIIAAANSTRIEAPGDIVVGASDPPCATCPAPMTKLEAEAYCAYRKMRFPTDLEWELAVRGVDGRVYPWGNSFDDKRANVPGLPQKGAPPPALKPVDAYPNERSPFGLVDTVGNAGDWVKNTSGDYERVYMGATYRFNPEDATAFRMLPLTEEDTIVREITARCVAQK